MVVKRGHLLLFEERRVLLRKKKKAVDDFFFVCLLLQIQYLILRKQVNQGISLRIAVAGE